MECNMRAEASPENRNRIIVRTSVIGILTNLVLAGFKAAVGVASNSIAVILDAVNNLSDMLSSIVTIAGAWMARKSPDRDHPLGHGRIEYLSALVVAGIILYAGITSLLESVHKIIEPETAEYSAVTLVVLGVAIAVKLALGRYVKQKGRQARSASLEASGSDASFDAILSASVLASALIFMIFGISLEAWVGVAISLFIIRAGVGMISGTLSDILGRRADEELSRRIRSILTEEPEVHGAYDLMLHNYGPERNYGSVHLELRDTMTVEEVDELTRRLERRVYQETGTILTGIGVYAWNTGDNEAARIRNSVQKMVLSHDWVLQVHGFHVNTEKKEMRFDAVLSFDVDPAEGERRLREEVSRAWPDYAVDVTPDLDMAD